jgi:hypothetical protein
VRQKFYQQNKGDIMTSIEMLFISLAMIAQGAVTEVKQKEVSNLTSPTAMVKMTVCDPAVKVVQTKKPILHFVRCMTNKRQWEEGWTAWPQHGGVLIWRGIVAGPHQPLKVPLRSENQKHTGEIYNFGNLENDKDI